MTDIAAISLPRSVAQATQQHLWNCGKRGVEGMALWIGRIESDRGILTEALIPKQSGLRTEHGLAVTVDGAELHRINVYLHQRKLRLIAQVHSHPGRAYHSDTDDRYAIATTLGCFSLVVPDFATGPFAIEAFATYRLLEGKWFWDKAPRWRHIAPGRAAQIIKLEP
jgi:proteasome lid subunit RPN8/RPN11